MHWIVPLLLSVDVGDGRSVAGLSKAIQSAVAALDVTAIVVPLFVAAMGTMIVGLLLFLLEVQLAISQNPRRYY
ncbi:MULTISPECIES: DUF2721 domain-containing protein [unclassified Cyanobium]|uniref:DUF2721 domain-containing protein n=1 Tax=unclassified Cyanobium TaxID=2627006 RepID=UPI0020CD85F3|nr:MULTISPECIES: DUF2721 domain-containing protein [unclassified Cyanobium]MCP9858335.1 DUF2721 domain-containing protein [Cyanobium sp. Cruz-8H5]MCP9865716.1 DUF2721 domain-containing protein [Cyanobium sp. Cruz-8D1]